MLQASEQNSCNVEFDPEYMEIDNEGTEVEMMSVTDENNYEEE